MNICEAEVTNGTRRYRGDGVHQCTRTASRTPLGVHLCAQHHRQAEASRSACHPVHLTDRRQLYRGQHDGQYGAVLVLIQHGKGLLAADGDPKW